jgi:hypothetical protein
MQAIDEASYVGQGSVVGIIGFEMINELSEAIDIVLDGCELANAIEFAKQELVLISIKTSVQSLTKLCPGHRFQFFSHGLNPSLGRAKELHT